jgi:hypothetical protein
VASKSSIDSSEGGPEGNDGGAWGILRAEVRDNDIIITLPGTSYAVTYYKVPNYADLPL